jgi:hypothetical protein
LIAQRFLILSVWTAAVRGLGEVWRNGYRYKKAGVMLLVLVRGRYGTTRCWRVSACWSPASAQRRPMEALEKGGELIELLQKAQDIAEELEDGARFF